MVTVPSTFTLVYISSLAPGNGEGGNRNVFVCIFDQQTNPVPNGTRIFLLTN